MLHTTVIISTNITLNKLDVFLIANIMEKTRNLTEVSRQVVELVLALYRKVTKTPVPTLTYVQERAEALKRILRSLDDLTWKMQPFPNRTWSVHTETILCYTWDLTYPNVINKLPIGLRLSNADDTGRGDILYNGSEVFLKTDASIFLSRKFLLNLLNGTRADDIRMSVTLYKDPFLFTKASKTEGKYRLISKVLAAKIVVNGAVITDLAPELVTMVFSKTKVGAGVVKTCGYWNFSLSGWSTDGCELSLESSDQDVCTCDHLTNFALLLDLEGEPEDRSLHSLPLSVITILGLSLSILGLSGTLLSFVMFKKLREKHPQQTLFNLALAELCAWLVFLAGISQTRSYAGCTLVAILLHYFLLASFMWMLAEAFLHYLLLVKVQAQGTFTNRYMLKIGIPAWSIPLIPVLIVLAVDPGLYRGRDRHCWMSLSSSIYAFVLPVGIVIFCNIVIYILVVVRIFRMSKAHAGSTKGNKKREVLKIRVPILCFVLFGLGWTFGFLAVSEAKVVFQYLFCLTSSTQGFLIFIFFTAGNEDVRQLWSRLCCREKRECLIQNKKKEISRSNMITRTTGEMETSF